MAWSPEDKTRAMVVLAAHAGNCHLTAQVLKSEYGMNVPAGDLRKWRTSTMREEYDRILEDMPDMTSVVINETLETARLAAQAEKLAIERTLHDLQQGTCKDPARAARDLSHIKATNVEKFLTLSGRPTQIVDAPNLNATLQELLRDGVFQPIADDVTVADEDVFEIPDEALQLPAGLTPDP